MARSGLETYVRPDEGIVRYRSLDELNARSRESGVEFFQLQPGRFRGVYRVASPRKAREGRGVG